MQPLSAKECSTWFSRFAQALIFLFVAIAQLSKGALLQFIDKGVFGDIPALGAFATR